MMNLKELKEKFDKLNDDHVLDYGIDDVFSWRGSYDEVCFSIGRNVSVKRCKELIDNAYNETFYGYKGGEYRFCDYTPVNFESGEGRWSDEEYREEMIDEIEGEDKPSDRDSHLADLLVASCF